MPIVFDAHETIRINMEKRLKDLEIRIQAETNKTTKFFTSARKLRTVPEIWEDLLPLWL